MSLSTSNREPLESERPFVSEHMAQEKERLSLLDQRIAHVQAMLQTLLDQRIAHVQAMLQMLLKERSYSQSTALTCACIFSSVRRLPLDVLQEIFGHCRKAFGKDFFMGESSTWAASHVCKSWRDAALLAPTLWSDVKIDWGHNKRTNFFLTLQLERSGNAALYVSFFNDSIERMLECKCLDTLLPHSSRIKTLSLVLPVSGINHLTALPFTFPSLEHFEVVPFRSTPQSDVDPSPFLSDALILKTVYGPPRLLTALGICWGNIVDYKKFNLWRFGRLPALEALYLLRDARDLRSAEILFSLGWDTTTPSFSVVHSGLVRLSLFPRDDDPHLCLFLLNATLPRLEDLTIWGCMEQRIFDTLVAKFLPHSGKNLKRFAISVTPFSRTPSPSNWMRVVVEHMPALENLTTTGYPIHDDHVVDGIRSDPSFLPNLRFLNTTGVDEEDHASGAQAPFFEDRPMLRVIVD